MTALTDRLLADLSSALGLPIGNNEGELSATRALAELNDAYRFEIPGQLSGWRREGTVEIAIASGQAVLDSSTTALDAEYGLPGAFKVVHEPVLLSLATGTGTWPLDFYTYPEEFWSIYQFKDTAQAQPSACLYYDNSLLLRPIPNASYKLQLFGIKYPGKLEDLASSKLDTAFEETLVVAAAAVNLALAEGLGEAATRLGNYFVKKMNIAAAQTMAGAGRRRRVQRRFF